MIVAGMATMKHREASFRVAVASLLPQVDVLAIYLNGYKEPPWFLEHAKVTRITSYEAGFRGAEAKFFWSSAAKFRALLSSTHAFWTPDDVYLTVDDDIEYPDDYVQRMIEGLDRHSRSAVGAHGVRFRQPIEGYYRSMEVLAPFQKPLAHDLRMHLLGTATVAFRPYEMKLDFDKFYIPNMADLWFAIQAMENRFELWSIARPARWLVPLKPPGYSISRATSGGRDLAQTEIAQSVDWPTLSP